MMLLPNVIKNRAIVDHAGEASLPPPDPNYGATVLKGGRGSLKYDPALLRRPSRDDYLDELNRLRVDLDDIKKELRNMEREREALQAEIAELEVEREKLVQYEGMDIDGEIVSRMKQAEREAASIRNQAAAEAEAIRDQAIQEAKETAETLKSQGYLDGLEQGANEARLQVRDENQPGIEILSALMEELSGIQEGLLARNEDEMVDLVMTIAEKVVGRQIQEDPGVVVDMLRDVLEKNRREDYIKIRIAKDLMPAGAKVSGQVREILETLCQQVDIVVETEAPPGQLIVETSGGFTDLSVQTQLGNINEVLREERMSEQYQQNL